MSTETENGEEGSKPLKAKKAVAAVEGIWGKDVASHGYAAVPSVLIRGQRRIGISPTQLNIIVQLLDYWRDPARKPFPSKRDLANRMGVTQKTVQNNIRELEKKGLVQREFRKTIAGDYNSNVYHLDGLVEQVRLLEPEFEAERVKRREKAKQRRTAETPPHLREEAAA